MVSKAIEMGGDELLRLFVYLYGPSSTSILVSDSWGSFVLLRFPSSLFISFPLTSKFGKTFKFTLFGHYKDVMVSQKFLRLTYTCDFAPKGLKSSEIAKRKLPESFVKLSLTVSE